MNEPVEAKYGENGMHNLINSFWDWRNLELRLRSKVLESHRNDSGKHLKSVKTLVMWWFHCKRCSAVLIEYLHWKFSIVGIEVWLFDGKMFNSFHICKGKISKFTTNTAINFGLPWTKYDICVGCVQLMWLKEVNWSKVKIVQFGIFHYSGTEHGKICRAWQRTNIVDCLIHSLLQRFFSEHKAKFLEQVCWKQNSVIAIQHHSL